MPNPEIDDRISTPEAATTPTTMGGLDMEALDRGEVIRFRDPSGREAVATKVVTPEFYQKYMAGNRRVETIYPTAPTPTLEERDAMYTAINQHWSALQEIDPETVSRIIRYPWLISADANIAAALGASDGYGPAEFSSRALLGDMNVAQYESYEQTWREGQVTRIFLDSKAQFFAPEELDTLSTIFATMDLKSREHLSGLAMMALRNIDLTDPNDKMKFMSWFYTRGAQENQSTLQRIDSPYLFKALDVPQDLVADFVENKLLPYFSSPEGYLDPKANPDEWALQSALSAGEQFASKMNIDVLDDNYRTVAGIVDFSAEIGLDPANLLFAAGAANKIAQAVPKVGKAAEMGRLALAARSIIPFTGRKLGEQVLPRGPMVRAFWSFLAKDVDTFIEQPRMVDMLGRAWTVFDKAGRGDAGLAAVVQHLPALESVTYGLGTQLRDTTSAEGFRWVIANGLRGSYTNTGTEAFLSLQRAAKTARDNYLLEADEMMGRGDLDIHGLSGFEGVSARDGLWEIDPNQGNVLRRVDIPAPGANPTPQRRLILRSNARIAGLNHGGVDMNSAAVLAGKRPEGLSAIRWLSGQSTRPISDKTADVVRRVLKSQGLHGAMNTKGELIVTDTRKLASIMDGGGSPEGMMDLAGQLNEMMLRKNAVVTARSGDRAWVISDIPVQGQFRQWWESKKWWKRFASNDADGWWGNYRRRVSAFTFNPIAPSRVHIGDPQQGAKELVSIMRRMGAKQSTIEEYYARFFNVAFDQRLPLVLEAIQRVGKESGIMPLQHHLVEWANREGAFAFAFDGTGEQLGLAASRSHPGTLSPRPIMTSQLANHIDIPMEAILSTMKRWRQTKNPFEKILVRGLATKTKTTRAKLANDYKTLLEKRGLVQGINFSEDDLMAMAYSVVQRDGGEGVGYLSALTNRLVVGPWNKIHSQFSMLQLSGRFIQWATRVVLLDESFRGALFDLPSLYRNPFRAFGEMWDAHLIAARNTFAQANKAAVEKAVNKAWTSAQGAISASINPTLDEVIEHLNKSLPGFADFVANRGLKQQSLAGVRYELFNYVNWSTGVDTGRGFLAGKGMSLGTRLRVRMRNRLINQADEVKKAAGLPADFDWQMTPEITMKGLSSIFTDEVASAVKVIQTSTKMTNREMSIAGRAWGKLVHQIAHDPVMRQFGLPRLRNILQGEDLTDSLTGSRLVQLRQWRQMSNIVDEMMAQAGVDPRGLGDLAKANWYLENIVDEHIRTVLRPWTSHLSPEDAAIAVDSLYSSRAAHVNIGASDFTMNVEQSNFGSGVREFQRLFKVAHGLDPQSVPARLTGMMNPRFAEMAGDNLISEWWGRMNNAIIQFGGEKMSQAINRRPAYLSTFKRWRAHYKGLGFDDKLAYELANEQAIKSVNYVYYNAANTTPLLKKFGRVVPFFGAMWEVAQTWAYKIPFERAGVLGVPETIRKVDRIYDALGAMGILRFEASDPDEKGNRDIQMYLVATEDPELLATMAPLARTASKAGKAMANGISTIIKQFTHLRNEGANQLEETNKDTYQWAVGNPFEFWNSYGIMAVNQFYLSPNPVGSLAVSNLLRKIPAVTDNKAFDARGGQSLDEIATAMGTDAASLLQANRAAIGDSVGWDKISQYNDGSLTTADLVLTDDLVLSIPGTSLIDNLLADIVFPFGEVESPAGVLREFVPQWAQYVLRGYGLWHGSDNDKFWTTDHEGNVVLNSTFLQVLTHPGVDRMGMGGQINVEIMNLEAAEGVLSKWTQLADEVNRLRDLNSDVEGAEFKEAKMRLEAYGESIIKRAVDAAGTAQFMRGMLGFVGPSSPRMYYKEQLDVAAYWNAQDAARDYWTGRGLHESMLGNLPSGGVKNVEAFNQLLTRFLDDPSSDESRAWLRKTYPEMWAFAFGKTYWGPGGPPPESQSFDQLTADIDAGLRVAYAPDVMLQRMARSAVAADTEFEIIDTYGRDPDQAAVAILEDYKNYQRILEGKRAQLDGLDYYDDFFNGGAYLEWRNRNKDDDYLLAEERASQVFELMDAFQQVEDLLPEADMDPAERREFSAQLNKLNAGVKDKLDQYLNRSTQWDSPRDKAVNWYFEQVMVPYSDGLNKLYERLDASTDSEDQSKIQDEIREYRNEAYLSRYLNPNNGLEYPNILDWFWNKKDPEEQRDRLMRWANQPVEWLHLEATNRLVENEPVLAHYLPTTNALFQPYSEFNQLNIVLSEMREPKPDQEALPSNIATKAGKAIDERLRAQLIAEGRLGEVEWQEMVPIERLRLAGFLPESLDTWADQATYIRQQVAVAEKDDRKPATYTSTVRKKLREFLWVSLNQELAVNPTLREDMRALGLVVFDEAQIDQLFDRLFFGKMFGEI